jgi:hypothetical protein
MKVPKPIQTGIKRAARKVPRRTPHPAANPNNQGGDVNTAMKNVNYHLTDRIIVTSFRSMASERPEPDQMVVFDDRPQNVALSTTSLGNELDD